MRLFAIIVLLAVSWPVPADEATRALAAQIEALETNKSLNDEARITQMYDGLMTLADLPPDAAVEPLLERHAKAGYRLPGFRTDDGHRMAITTHDTSAAAQFALDQWARERGRILAEVALRARTGAFDFKASEATLAGYAQAFAAASDAELSVTRSGITAALADGARVEPLLLILFERLHDADLAKHLLAQGDDKLVVHMLPRIADALPAETALALFTRTTPREGLASALVAQIGRLSGKSRAAHDWLLARLGDPALGPSAAAALARTGDPVAVAALADTLHDPNAAGAARARAALGLKLADTRAAQDALKQFVDDPSSPPALRTQVSGWLR